jgi:hypothetical protein
MPSDERTHLLANDAVALAAHGADIAREDVLALRRASNTFSIAHRSIRDATSVAGADLPAWRRLDLGQSGTTGPSELRRTI